MPFLLLASFVTLAAPGLSESPSDLFKSKVAPILERRCVSCHQGENAKGKLALDTRASFLKGGESGPLVDRTEVDESLLLERVRGPKPSMPKNGEPLSDEDLRVLREWLASGAEWPEGTKLVDRKFEGETWWAFRPLNRPKVPDSSNPGWGRTPIDAFILKALDDAGMKPSPEADRRTLIRRLSFDLTGLPPTPEEVDAFLKDERPDAYDRVVRRLLDSPAHGERWARHWLDVAHYGDTHGYDKDKRRDNAWPYRDYVVAALNRDTPYADFIKEQVAGDVLFPGTAKGVIATGFLAAGPWDFVGHVELREGTVDKEKTRHLDRDDMVTTVMSTFNSVTIGCARCHDHKFDPIPQRDYYRLQAVFAGIDRGDRVYDDGSALTARNALESERADLTQRRNLVAAEIAERVKPATTELDLRIERLKIALNELPPNSRKGNAPSRSNGFHSPIFSEASSPAWVTVDLGKSYPLEEIRLVPARPTDFPDTPGFGFPREYKVEAGDDPNFKSGVTVLSTERIPDFEKTPDEPVVIRPKRLSARYVRVSATRLWRRTGDYVFALAELEAICDGVNRARGAVVTASGSIEAGRWSVRYLVDGFDSRASRPEAIDVAAAKRHDLLFELADTTRERRLAADRAAGPELAAKRDALAAKLLEIEAKIAGLPKGPMVYAVKPLPPRPIRVLARGEVEKARDLVGPGTLSCLPGMPSAFADSADEGARRAALARWIASRDNPLTWRSIVNRVWHYHVGKGIVDTPSDFGRNGSKPTHPELLDWLAVEFRDGGGSLKELHRLIVTSSFYRQSSADDPAKAAKDGENRLLWRMNRRRLEAEAVRDAVLLVAGTLDRKVGGPAFEPFRFKDDHSPIYDHTAVDRITAPEMRRRSIYRFAVRSVPHPFLECLDAADPNSLTPARSTTVTALQALALWNDPFMLAQSEAFAARCRDGGDLDKSVATAVRFAFGRECGDEERRVLTELARTRGLSEVCRVLFNTNEFVFVD